MKILTTKLITLNMLATTSSVIVNLYSLATKEKHQGHLEVFIMQTIHYSSLMIMFLAAAGLFATLFI